MSAETGEGNNRALRKKGKRGMGFEGNGIECVESDGNANARFGICEIPPFELAGKNRVLVEEASEREKG